MITIAAVLACHNRVAKTLDCLEALHGQQSLEAELRVYLLDDASTDGTAQAVARQYSTVRILHGDGSRYWNGGMRIAFEAATRDGADHYLWLNDDTVLDPTALTTLLDTYEELAVSTTRPVIVSGATRDPQTSELTYGGLRRQHRGRPLRFTMIEPRDGPQPIDAMHGNCVLIPDAAARRVGNLEADFQHGLGDYDYALRSWRSGCEVWLAPGTVATCPPNPPPPVGVDAVRSEWRRLQGPKGLPLEDWKVFARRWGGPFWPLYWISPYVRHGLRTVRSKGRRLTGVSEVGAR